MFQTLFILAFLQSLSLALPISTPNHRRLTDMACEEGMTGPLCITARTATLVCAEGKSGPNCISPRMAKLVCQKGMSGPHCVSIRMVETDHDGLDHAYDD